MSGKLDIVSLKPHLNSKRDSIDYNEVSSHKRYNSVNTRSITKNSKMHNNNHLRSDMNISDHLFPGGSNRKNHSQIARMELNELESDPFSIKSSNEHSRQSVRKRFKMPQISGKKKLPNWFSITSKELNLSNLHSKQLNFDDDLNNTMNVTFRKVQSEQVSPRAMIHKEYNMPKVSEVKPRNKFFMSNISKQEWNDPKRFAPIINHL